MGIAGITSCGLRATQSLTTSILERRIEPMETTVRRCCSVQNWLKHPDMAEGLVRARIAQARRDGYTVTNAYIEPLHGILSDGDIYLQVRKPDFPGEVL